MPSRRWPSHLLLAVLLATLSLGCRRSDPPTPSATPAIGPTATPGVLRSYRFRLSANVTSAFGAPPAASGSPGAGTCAGSTPGWTRSTGVGPAGAPAERITITLDGEVNGDRQQLRTCANLGFALIDSERVQIGPRVWSRDGSMPWREEPTGGAGASAAFGLDTAVTTLMSAGLPRQMLNKLQPTPDRVNEVDAFRYLLDPQQTAEMLGGKPGGSPLGSYRGGAQLWVARWGATPLRLILDGSEPGSEPGQGGRLRLQLDIRDHNSQEIAIEPPA